jgi:hypothetical protein
MAHLTPTGTSWRQAGGVRCSAAIVRCMDMMDGRHAAHAGARIARRDTNPHEAS